MTTFIILYLYFTGFILALIWFREKEDRQHTLADCSAAALWPIGVWITLFRTIT